MRRTPRFTGRRRAALLWLAVAAGLALGAWHGSGPTVLQEVWERLYGPPDLGPFAFGSARRRSSPNDALACPPGLCPNAEADIVPPVLPVTGERLRAIVAEVAATEPDTERVASDQREPQDRYLARTRLFRFPDTIDVRIVEAGEGRSTLALYSRSQIGYSDLGVNRARIERWLQRVSMAAEAN